MIRIILCDAQACTVVVFIIYLLIAVATQGIDIVPFCLIKHRPFNRLKDVRLKFH
jgi:hypothetical protein